MTEVISDESKIEVVDGKILVTREIKESYDCEEFIRRCGQMEQTKEHLEKQKEECIKNLNIMAEKLPEAEKLREVELDKAKEERETALAKETNANNP
jgi:hypothetical protein